MRLLCGIALVVGAACGGGATGGTAQPGTTPRGSTTAGPQASGLGPQPGVGPQPSQQPLVVEDRCNKLIEHVVTLAVAERPAEQKVSDDERKNIATQLRSSWGPKCNAMTEPGYRCAVNAPTLADLDRCGG